MKEILLVDAKKYPKVVVVWQRQFLETRTTIISLHAYAIDHHLSFANQRIADNQEYIDILLERVDSLYRCYELEWRYFDVLNSTAINLERLYSEKLATLTETAGIDQTKTELADYLDKVTMIFQTAADKTEDKDIREFCAAKAKQYSGKADQIRGRIFPMNYTAKLQALYENAAAACGFDFIRELLQARADEYKQKHVEEVAKAHGGISRFWSSASSEKLERQPLLAESQDGLRRRVFTTPNVQS